MIIRILIASLAFLIISPAYADEPSLLPDGEIIYDKQGLELGIQFTKEEYRVIVQIYNDYLLLSSNDSLWRRMHDVSMQLKQIQHERLMLCFGEKEILETTSDDMYSLWQEEHDLRKAEKETCERKKKITLFSAGLGGAAIGAAIAAILILLL